MTKSKTGIKLARNVKQAIPLSWGAANPVDLISTVTLAMPFSVENHQQSLNLKP
jgi:hypothetical protein